MNLHAALRHHGGDPERGAYAILYAAFIVVFVAIAAIVVDIAAVRQDRRVNRASADSAVLAGAAKLSPLSGFDPRGACDDAWAYLMSNTPRLTKPASACMQFNQFRQGNSPYQDPAAYCSSGGGEISDTVDVPPWRITIAWPIPSNSRFLAAAIAPGTVAQPYDQTYDGAEPCRRLGVAVEQARTFGLGSGIGVGGVTTDVHSVARNVTRLGSTTAVAALNVLAETACQALGTSGQGQIVVNRTNASQGGIIAVESSGADCGNGAPDKVIALSMTNPNKICASGPAQVPNPATTDPNSQCDGQGSILVYARNNPATDGKSYPNAPGSPGVNLRPTPTSLTTRSGWDPVTDLYGCQALVKPNYTSCLSPKPPYIRDLHAAYGGNGAAGNGTAPTQPYLGIDYAAPPGSPPGGSFETIPGSAIPTFTCDANSDIYIPAGNWFVDCPDTQQQAGFSVGGAPVGQSNDVVFGGGNIVFRGGISVSNNNACLAINVPLGLAAGDAPSACPAISGSGNEATTSPAPTRDAQVFIRGQQGLTTGASNTRLRMPQTFVYQMGRGPLALGGGSNSTLWTSPGAGALVAGRRVLDALCTPMSSALSATCMDSRFSRVAYWNESIAPVSLTGQAGLALVGVFFTPRSDVTYGGLTAYAGNAFAQFWSNTLALTGQANLVLTPDPNFSVPRRISSVVLIR